MTKSKKITIITLATVAVLLLALLISFCVYATRPVGIVTRKDLRVSTYFAQRNIVVPLKMVKGVYSPSTNYFNSKLTVEEICALVSETYDCEIMGGDAIIRDKSAPKFAHAQVINISNLATTTYKYVLSDGGKQINDKYILMPLYLLDGFDMLAYFEGVNTINAKLKANVGLDKIIDFYKIDGYYGVEQSGSTITVTGLTAQHNEKFTVTYNTSDNTLTFTII